MAVYNFKNTGKTKKDVSKEKITETVPAFGIKTPLQLGNLNNEILAMNYSLSEQLADNLRNLLLTNWGERLGLYEFGANLRPLTTDLSSQENFDNEAIERIKKAVEKWMPYIELETFESNIDRINNDNTGVINISITYRIPMIEQDKRGIQVNLYVI